MNQHISTTFQAIKVDSAADAKLAFDAAITERVQQKIEEQKPIVAARMFGETVKD